MKAELSVFLITKQEEANIKTCLESIKDIADEIIVVDSNSSDKTVEIAKSFGAQIYFKDFFSFTEQKNFALSKVTKPWALNLDADEYLTPKLAAEIKKLLTSAVKENGFYLKRSSVFLGRKMKYSGMAKELCLRLVKTSAAKYEGGRVHETLKVEGQTAALENCFMHNTYTSIKQYFDKFNNYTSLAALTMAEKGKKFNPVQLLRQPFEFIKIYFFRLGFLDGLQGFLWALFSSFYPVVKYAKLWDIKRNK